MLPLVLFVLCIGPLIGIASVVAHSRWREVSLTSRRLTLGGLAAALWRRLA